VKGKELLIKIKSLQKKIKLCSDDRQALMMQKELVDLLSVTLESKEFLKNIIAEKKENNK